MTITDKDRALTVKLVRLYMDMHNEGVADVSSVPTADKINRLLAQHREEAVRELEVKLDTILYDTNYMGGLQYWIRKHDQLLIEITKHRLNAAMKAAT